MSSSEGDSQNTSDTQKVSVRLPVELVDRADFASTVRGISRRKLIETAIYSSLSARERDTNYRDQYRAAQKRGQISHEALISALGENPFDYDETDQSQRLSEEEIDEIVSTIDEDDTISGDGHE